MIKILVDGHIFNTYPHGGIARYFREIFTRIVSKNNDIHFYITIDEKSAGNLPIHTQIHPLVFHPLRLRPSRIFNRLDSWRFKRFKQTIIGLSPQIFHSTYYTLPPFDGMKNVATVYDLIDHQFPLMHPNGFGFTDRQRNALVSADRVISISDATTKLAIRAFGLDSQIIHTVPLGASDAFYPNSEQESIKFRKDYSNGKPYFLFLGATGTYKNLATLVRGFGLIADKTDHLLVLAGHSMQNIESWIIDIAIQAGVEDKIIVLNHPDDQTLRLAYGAATAFVFPSLQEGFGIPLLESMRCDCQVIASDIPVFREVCQDSAIYFDPHSHTQLASAMLEALNLKDDPKVSQLRAVQSAKYSWDLAAKHVENIYRDI